MDLKSRLQKIHEKIMTPEYQLTFHQDLVNKLKKDSESHKSFGIKSNNIVNFVEDFSNISSTFGDGTNGWIEWGGDYFPAPNKPGSITLYNPKTQTATLQTGLNKTIALSSQAGDTIIAKMEIDSTFTSNSDTTLVLYFNDANNTVAVSDTARGTLAGKQTLYLETVIPEGATQVTIAPLVYLAQNETSSLTIDNISLEQIPAGYYNTSVIADEPLDKKLDTIFGTNSPEGIDEEFGYDFYVVDNWPLKYAGDGAVTVWNPGPGNHSSLEGGMVKKIPLSNVQPGETLSAYLFTAATFTDPTSFALFKIEFFDVNNNLLSTKQSSLVRGNNYKWLVIDREVLPTGSAYAKVTPTLKLGANETSALLWDDLRVFRSGLNTTLPTSSISANIGSSGGTLEIPGVAKLVIPANALTQNTLIAIEQQAVTPALASGFSLDGSNDSTDYASPTIKISPIGLTLQKPAQLYLKPDAERIGNNHPMVAPVYLSSTLTSAPSSLKIVVEASSTCDTEWHQEKVV